MVGGLGDVLLVLCLEPLSVAHGFDVHWRASAVFHAGQGRGAPELCDGIGALFCDRGGVVHWRARAVGGELRGKEDGERHVRGRCATVRRVAGVDVCAGYGGEKERENGPRREKRMGSHVATTTPQQLDTSPSSSPSSGSVVAAVHYITRPDLDPHATLCLAGVRSFFHSGRVSIDKERGTRRAFHFSRSAQVPCLASRGVPCAREHVYYFHPLGIASTPSICEIFQNGIYPGLTPARPLSPLPLLLYPSLTPLQLGRLNSNPSPIRAYLDPPTRDTARSLAGSMVPSVPNTDLRT